MEAVKFTALSDASVAANAGNVSKTVYFKSAID